MQIEMCVGVLPRNINVLHIRCGVFAGCWRACRMGWNVSGIVLFGVSPSVKQ